MMTVEKLIEELREYPPDARVTVAVEDRAGADSSFIAVSGNSEVKEETKLVTITRVRY